MVPNCPSASPVPPAPSPTWSPIRSNSNCCAPVPRHNTPTMALTCGLTGTLITEKIASCACPPALPHHAASVRLADGTGPQPGVEERGNHGAASRSCSATAPGRTPEAGLGRSSRPGGVGPMATSGAARSATRYPSDAAVVASSFAPAGLDLSTSARTSNDKSRDPGLDSSPGAGEPRGGPSTGTGGNWCGSAFRSARRPCGAFCAPATSLRRPVISTPHGAPSTFASQRAPGLRLLPR